ncbi:MAG: DUF2461 domain-containing protein [Bacteroidetes bacterium]|nr:DUF2461 domain-containing protein [Bacteroidota bacterium]
MARPVNPFNEDTLPPFGGFPKDTLRFLRELKKNNSREWFTENKHRYEQAIKEPMLMLLESLAARLRVAHPDIVLEPKKAMYRIYRDVRFSADKSPYKEWVAAAFTYRGFDRKQDAAFYFHFSPEEFGIGGGLYAPTGDRLKNVRKAIDADASPLHAILKEKSFRKYFGELQGEELARVPQGFDKEHPEVALLRKKQFLCWATQPTSALADAAVVELLLAHFSAMAPFVRWLVDHS